MMRFPLAPQAHQQDTTCADAVVTRLFLDNSIFGTCKQHANMRHAIDIVSPWHPKNTIAIHYMWRRGWATAF
eukprot:6485818-Prorocentrum_lima.AAC.1